MRIGELAKRSGFSTDTLRWYEKIGLISLPRNSRDANNYRKYDKAILRRLANIKELKGFGFTLKEIKELLLLDEEEQLNCEEVSQMVLPKIAQLEAKIQELQQLKSKLKEACESCQGDCRAVFNQS